MQTEALVHTGTEGYFLQLLIKCYPVCALNKRITQTLQVITQVQTGSTRGFCLLASESQVFSLDCFPLAAVLLPLKKKDFFLFPYERPPSSRNMEKPLKRDNISFLLMLSFTFRLSKQSRGTAVWGCQRAQRRALFCHNYKPIKTTAILNVGAMLLAPFPGDTDHICNCAS